MIKVHL